MGGSKKLHKIMMNHLGCFSNHAMGLWWTTTIRRFIFTTLSKGVFKNMNKTVHILYKLIKTTMGWNKQHTMSIRNKTSSKYNSFYNYLHSTITLMIQSTQKTLTNEVINSVDSIRKLQPIWFEWFQWFPIVLWLSLGITFVKNWIHMPQTFRHATSTHILLHGKIKMK